MRLLIMERTMEEVARHSASYDVAMYNPYGLNAGIASTPSYEIDRTVAFYAPVIASVCVAGWITGMLGRIKSRIFG